MLQSRRTGRIDSQLHAPAHHGRYVTSAPCFTLAELSAAIITLRLATVDTSLPHRASLSPSWAHRLTITCSSLPRPLLYLGTVLQSRRAERIDDYPPPRHGHYTSSVARFTLAELGAFTITAGLATSATSLPLRATPLTELDSPSRRVLDTSTHNSMLRLATVATFPLHCVSLSPT